MGKGGAKLAWFMMLKNSARNCTLKLSEIFLTAKFLYTEKSRLTRGGPSMLLRPALPSRFEQVPAMPGVPGSVALFVPGNLKPNGTHCEASVGSAGAFGRVKQAGLR